MMPWAFALARESAGNNIAARIAWAGSQRYPIHWGGDAESTDEGMAAELRGGLSFGLSGFSFWSHDVGGFTATSVDNMDKDLFARWLAFGMLTSHSRTKLLKDGHIDTIIGLPANLFYSTGIPVCILVLKRCKKFDDVLFINASGPENFEEGKRQNVLLEEHIEKIIETYKLRNEEPRYSKRISMERIAEEGYNLNISRYVSTAVAEEEIDLATTHNDLTQIEQRIQEAARRHNEFLKELGLAPIPFGETGKE